MLSFLAKIIKGGLLEVISSKSKDFSFFILSYNLHDLGFVGPHFTWCNSQDGLARRWARLDHFLANSHWLLNYNSFTNKHLICINSDHTPLLLTAFDSPPCFNKIFRFENTCLDYDGCHRNDISAWNATPSSSPMHSFTHFISCTKRNLCKLKRSNICHFDDEIQNIEREISSLDQNNTLSDDSWRNNWLKALRNRHSTLLRQKLIY